MKREPISLKGTSDDEIFEFGRNVYSTTYLNQTQQRGELKSHDNQTIVFFADRYDHAFRTSPDRARRAYDKSKVALDRIERIIWIKEILQKHGEKIVCKEQTPPPRWKRAYYCYENNYVVWLEPMRIIDGYPSCWKFSSAYPQPVTDFKRTTRGFKTIA